MLTKRRGDFTNDRAILSTVSTTTTRRTRSDGERSRRTILLAAARLATVEGLGGLTIGRLAAEMEYELLDLIGRG